MLEKKIQIAHHKTSKQSCVTKALATTESGCNACHAKMPIIKLLMRVLIRQLVKPIHKHSLLLLLVCCQKQVQESIN